jgi:methyl-accepting chemotaxis protein/methyl-accepting chemotaxis protein-1 (serine sensor receptor)
LRQRQLEHLESDKKSAADMVSACFWLAIGVTLVGLVLGGVVAFVVHRSSVKLSRLARDLGQGSVQVASVASQISSSAQSLAQGASEQAASLQETSSSTEEITSMTHKNADNSKGSSQLMVDMSQQVSEGNQKLDLMVASMKEINHSSEKISKIIQAIDEIAFQTNILALNAAVEAARAGEAGMGFAVVADEVRNLAQRCAVAAKDTASLIEESMAKSVEGSRRLDEVAGAIAGITDNAAKVKILVDEVHVGSQEQARGLDQVSKAISQMEQVTQKTAASAEQSAAAGQELSAQSETLRALVDQLGVLVNGGAEPSPPERHPRGRAFLAEQRQPQRDVVGGEKNFLPRRQSWKER